MPAKEPDGTRVANTGKLTFRPAAELGMGTRVADATKALATGHTVDVAKTTRFLQNSELLQESNGLVEALLNLRDALVTPTSGSAARTLGTRVADAGTIYGAERPISDAALDLYIILDGSPSMEDRIRLEGWTNLHDQLDGTKKHAEKMLIGMVGGAAEQLSQGSYGETRIGVYMLGLDESNSDLLRLPGAVDTKEPDSMAKVIKRLEFDFTPEDQTGIYMLLSNPSYSGNASCVAPALRLVYADMQADTAALAEIRQRKRAAIVMVISDGLLHDHVRSRTVAQSLESQGALVMGVVLGNSLNGLELMSDVTPGKVLPGGKGPDDLIRGVNQLAFNVRGGRI